jgi:uncharacterized protein YggU (UPF0235/DUF167 family)
VSASIEVRLTPRGGADRVDGIGPNGELLVRVAAAPVDGAANRSLLRFIAEELDVPPSVVVLESGQRSRRKRVLVRGVTAAALVARWPEVKPR